MADSKLNVFKATKSDVETINRLAQAVISAFNDLASPKILPVLTVTSSVSVKSYIVKPSDLFIVVNARGGPMKLVLPPPSGLTQAVSIKNAYSGGVVSIVQSDGKVMGDGTTAITLGTSESLQMVNTGNAWFEFGRT